MDLLFPKQSAQKIVRTDACLQRAQYSGLDQWVTSRRSKCCPQRDSTLAWTCGERWLIFQPLTRRPDGTATITCTEHIAKLKCMSFTYISLNFSQQLRSKLNQRIHSLKLTYEIWSSMWLLLSSQPESCKADVTWPIFYCWLVYEWNAGLPLNNPYTLQNNNYSIIYYLILPSLSMI